MVCTRYKSIRYTIEEIILKLFFHSYRCQLVRLGKVRVWWSFRQLMCLNFYFFFYSIFSIGPIMALDWIYSYITLFYSYNLIHGWLHPTSNTFTNKDILADWRYEMILSILCSGADTSVILMMILRHCSLRFLFHFIRSDHFFLK